jgi:predicted signal transduction protein with EAL and GGDEF domain
MSVLAGLLLVPLLALGWVPLIIGGAFSRIPAIWGLGIAVLLVQAGLLCRLAVTYREFLRVASRTLGIRVGWLDAPPPGERQYLAWCHNKGIEPFSAGRDSVAERRISGRSTRAGIRRGST